MALAPATRGEEEREGTYGRGGDGLRSGVWCAVVERLAGVAVGIAGARWAKALSFAWDGPRGSGKCGLGAIAVLGRMLRLWLEVVMDAAAGVVVGKMSSRVKGASSGTSALHQ